MAMRMRLSDKPGIIIHYPGNFGPQFYRKSCLICSETAFLWRNPVKLISPAHYRQGIHKCLPTLCWTFSNGGNFVMGKNGKKCWKPGPNLHRYGWSVPGRIFSFRSAFSVAASTTRCTSLNACRPGLLKVCRWSRCGLLNLLPWWFSLGTCPVQVSYRSFARLFPMCWGETHPIRWNRANIRFGQMTCGNTVCPMVPGADHGYFFCIKGPFVWWMVVITGNLRKKNHSRT